MSLYSISVRRPVLAVVMSLVIVLFGVIGFLSLGVREFPSVDAPVISVTTSYTGANADVVESQITQPLEEEVNSVAGIRSLTSISREGRSTLRVEFDLGVDLETAANDIRDRVSRAVRQLPPEADPPSVSKADADSPPIIFLNIQSDHRDLLELTAIAENDFKERVQTITGVSEVDIWGSKRPAMRLWMDPAKLAAYGLTPVDVRDALRRENVELPSGRIEGGEVELTVRTRGRLLTVEDFNDLVIKQDGVRLVRFSDIGQAEIGPENLRTILKRDGVPMVGVVLRPQPGANQIEIVDEFYRRVAQIEKDLPEDIQLGVGFDTSDYIRESVAEVQQTIFVALSLVVLIIFAFLRDWRTTVIPAVVIPVSLTGAFFIMYAAGFSINVLTLLGLVLAIGLVVDDAIVVLENIYAKIEDGIEPQQAGIEGTREIFFAVISTTLALVAVFMPILFMGGLTGRLFREFGVTLAGAVVISSFIALTLTPMLSTRLLHRRSGHSRFYHWSEPFFRRLTSGYRSSLEAFLRHRWLALVIIAACAGVIFWVGRSLPQELAPLEDRGRVRMNVTAPEGASYEYMEDYMDRLVALVQEEVPELQAVISVTSPGFGASSSVNSGFVRLILSPAEERQRSQQEISDDLSEAVQRLNGARVFVSQEQTIGSSRRGLPVQYVLQAPSFEKLREVLPEFLQAADEEPRFSAVDVDLKFNKPELEVHIDRDRARNLGVSALDIADTLNAALSGQRFGYFLRGGKQYQVVGQVQRGARDEPLDLRSLHVRAADGRLVQLDNLVRLEETSSPPQLYHYNRYVSATVSAGLARGVPMGEGIAAMDAIGSRVLDETFSTALTGPSRDFTESSSSLGFVFLLALVLMYLVLAAQFESFRDPFTIMLTVPLALCGAMVALALTGETLNVFSQIGLIMLIGLVTKNGILIVEFANQRRSRDADLLTAVQKAAAARFRPVLMTSLSTILGILPLALALGAGSESRASMGIAVIGGLLLGSLLTLYVIPAVYTWIAAPATERESSPAAGREAGSAVPDEEEDDVPSALPGPAGV
ncbi:MAG: efflux RND transporter permease subunit [Acidobacteriota bacterium]|nr:efflux RND transporter permease subunit [Acidobacteriota bacterium]